MRSGKIFYDKSVKLAVETVKHKDQMETNGRNGKEQHFLASNLRHLRKAMKMSQEDLAARVGLNRGNIASYEKGTAEPKVCNLFRLSEVFGVDPRQLVWTDLSNQQPTHNGHSPEVHRFTHEMRETIEQFESKANELQAVLTGLHTYYQYKKKTLDDLPDETRLMLSEFEKLYEVTQELMESHASLIELIKKKCSC